MIVTSSSGVGLTYADRADMVVPLIFRFVSGPLPTSHHLDEFLDGRLNPGIPEVIWADLVSRSPQTGLAHKNVALVRFCEIYGVELIELWFDPSPNNQLQLIWILDYLRAEPYMRPPSSLLSAILILKNQAAPCASVFTSAGSAASAALVSSTSPVTGA